MIITYHGKAHIKLQVGDLTVACGPVSKDSKSKQVKYGADIALIPMDYKDYNGIENVTHGNKAPFVINSAGEYEYNKFFVKAFATPSVIDGKEYQNISFIFNLDGIRVLYLGAIHQMLAPEHKEIIDNVDIIFVPVGGDQLSLNPYDASKLAMSLAPKVIIPIDYKEDLLPIFLKESGAKDSGIVNEINEKLTLKYKDISALECVVMRLHEM